MMLSLASLTLAIGLVSASSGMSPAVAARHHQLARRAVKRTDDNHAPVVTPNLPESWEVLSSCAKDDVRVMVQPDVFSLDTNTPESCVAYCDNNGYTYAGVEWSRECWCARSIYPELLEDAPESECNMPCTGDKEQACGAGGRIQLYYSTSTAQWDDAPLAPGWSTAVQCAIDTRAVRTLCNDHLYSMDEDNTPEACTALCAANGYKFAGLEYGKECHCGTGFTLGALGAVLEAPKEECWMGCTGDDTLACGAPDRIQVYVLDNAVSPPICVEHGLTIALPTPSASSTTTTTTTTSTTSSSTPARSISSTTSSSSSTTARSSSTTARVTTTSARTTSTRPWYRPTRTWRPKPCHKTSTTTRPASTSTTTARSTSTPARTTTSAAATTTKPCATPAPQTVTPGGQCGGLFWWGLRTCSSGYKCKAKNFLLSTCQK